MCKHGSYLGSVIGKISATSLIIRAALRWQNMKLAILGADHDILELARAVGASNEHEIVLICDEGNDVGYSEGLRAVVPRARTVEAWEGLIDAEQVDAVLVARGMIEDLREEQLRKFVQSGVPILTS